MKERGWYQNMDDFMTKTICFYDRVIVQKGEKYTILHNTNAMQTDKITTEVYELLNEVCDTKTNLNDVFKMIEAEEDKSYFSKTLKRLLKNKIIKFTDEISEYLDMNIQIDFDLTNKCNLKCKHCCVSADNSMTDLSTEEIFKAVDKILSLNPENFVISGGEPLMRKDFKQIINKIRESYNGRMSLMSNALLIDDKMAEFIAANFDFVSVSLDGVDEETCSIIRGSGTFDNALAAIKRLQCAGMKNISASMVLTKDTIDKKDYFVQMCKDMKIQPALRVLELVGRAEESMKDFIPVAKPVTEEDLIKQVNASDDVIARGNYMIFSCGAGYKQFQIDYRGNIYPCQSLMEDDLILGNIFQIEDFNSYIRNREFTNTPGYKLLEKFFPYNFEGCKGCNKQIFCWNCIAPLYRKQKKLEHCHFCNMAFERFFV